MDFGQQLAELQAQKLPYPNKPAKPVLKNQTAAGHREYADALECYENNMETYHGICNVADKHNGGIEQQIEALVKDCAGFNQIPEAYKNKVWARAWDYGHAEGWHSVHYHLCNLCEIFG